jgi:predicted GIY-YIG superfamily endonuclease
MAIEIVSMPLSATPTQYELMGDDERLKKRVEWAGEVERASVTRLGELLNQGYKIVDVQQYGANSYNWLRYTLHKTDGGEEDAVHSQFAKPLGKGQRGQAQYYLGYCDDERLHERIEEHRKGHGAAITRALKKQKISFHVAETFPGTRDDERRFKNWKNHKRVLKHWKKEKERALEMVLA